VNGGDTEIARVRREPPRFRAVAVERVEPVTPHLVRVVLVGAELEGMRLDEPAASVRILLPEPGAPSLVMPVWNGNEFRLPDGQRAPIRTLTPRHLDPDRRALTVEVVLHGAGIASAWAADARPGDPAAVSGPGRGYEVDAGAGGFLVAGDDAALPAVSQLLEVLPADRPVRVELEVGAATAQLALPEHPGATVHWHVAAPGSAPGDALVAAVGAAEIPTGHRIWVAGEAAAVQRIRRHLFEDRGVPRAAAVVRGYWKVGRGGT
jgi:NADPH-dependent ferric siderophore reductase